MVLLLSLLLLLALEETQSEPGCSCCDEMGIHIYEELGCEAVVKDHHACADYYKCPEFTTGNDYCMFGGKFYKLGERINGTSNCKICECKRTFIDGKFSAGVECLPVGGCPNYRNEDCTNMYLLDKCCPIGSECYIPGVDAYKCIIDDECYNEGERFVPRDSCHECVCRRGFTGEYVEPFCRRRRCDVEIHFHYAIRSFCAPVYYKPHNRNAICCPHRFICPDDDCKIKKGHAGFPGYQTCFFGEETFARNASFYIITEMEGGTNTVMCTCITPPLMTCIE